MRKYKFERKYLDSVGLIFYLKKSLLFLLIFCLLSFFAAILQNYSSQSKELEVYNQHNGIEQITRKLPKKELAASKKYYTDYEAMINQQLYNDTSLFMQIDSEQKKTIVQRYIVTSPNESFWFSETTTKMCNLWNAEEPYEYLAQRIEEELGLTTKAVYIKELFQIENKTQNQFNISISTSDQELLSVLASATDDYVNNQAKTNLKEVMGDFDITRLETYESSSRDNVIRDMQLTNINFINSYTSLLNVQKEALSDAANKYIADYIKLQDPNLKFGDPISYTQEMKPVAISKKEILLHGCYGVLIVIFLWLVFFTALFSFTPYIWTERNISDSFHLPTAGYLKMNLVNQSFPKEQKRLWDSFEKKQTKKERIFTSAYMNYLYKGYTQKENGTICFVLCSNLLSAADLENTVQALASKDGCKITIIDAKSILSDAKAGDVLTNADAILLSHITGKETYGQLDHVLALLQPYETKIIGDVLLF